MYLLSNMVIFQLAHASCFSGVTIARGMHVYPVDLYLYIVFSMVNL